MQTVIKPERKDINGDFLKLTMLRLVGLVLHVTTGWVTANSRMLTEHEISRCRLHTLADSNVVDEHDPGCGIDSVQSLQVLT